MQIEEKPAIFLPCHFAGRQVDENRRFCRLFGQSDLKHTHQCVLCPYNGKDVSTTAKLTPKCSFPYRQAGQELVCKHRGALTRTVGCEICGLYGRTASIYACNKYGECSWGRWTNSNDAPRLCVLCDDFEEANTIELPELSGDTYILYVRPESEERRKVQEAILASRTLPSTFFAVENAEFESTLRILTSHQNGITIIIKEPAPSGILADAHYMSEYMELALDTMLDFQAIRDTLQTNVVTGVFKQLLPETNVPWRFYGDCLAFRNKEIAQYCPNITSKTCISDQLAAAVPVELVAAMHYDGVGDLSRSDAWEHNPGFES